MLWRFFLNNATAGLLEIDEPVSYANMELQLVRDVERHGILKEFSVDFETADKRAIAYLENLYQNNFVDVNVELIVEEKAEDNDPWVEVHRGKLNIDQNKLKRTKLSALLMSATLARTEDEMRFFEKRDQQVDLELNKDFENNALPAYTMLPNDLTLKHRTILRKLDLQNDYDAGLQVANTNGYEDGVFPTICGGPTNNYTIEMLMTDPYDIPIDGNNHGHVFTAYIPIPFNKVIIDELNVANDVGKVQLCEFLSQVPNIITNDIYTTAAVKLNLEAIIAICILYCSEGNKPKVYQPGAYGSCVAGMNWDSVSLMIDINGVNVYSNWLFGAMGLGLNGTTTNFLDNAGEFYLFDYTGAFGSNTAPGCINPASGALFTGSAADIIHKGNISDAWAGTIPANSTCKIYLQVTCGGTYQNTWAGNPGANVHQKLYAFCQTLFNQNTWLKATVTHKFKDTVTKHFMIHEAFSRTVEAYTGNILKVYSDYYGRTDSQPFAYDVDGCGSLRTIMTGLFVRQFPSHLDTGQSPNNKARMSVSFDQIYEAMNAIDCIGYGIEVDPTDSSKKVVRIEPVEYFYNSSTVIMECDNVPELRRVAKTDNYISKFLFGYNKWEAESTMGLDEFNTKREYRNNLKTIKRTLEKKCDFIASGYTLEVERHEEFAIDPTKDTSYDNEIFLICLRRDGTSVKVEQGMHCLDIPGAQNVIDPDTVYNARISPVRNLLRWLKILNLTYFPLYSDPDALWIFAKGDANYNVIMELISGCFNEGNPLSESQNVSVADLTTGASGKPLVKPQVVDYDYPVSWAQYNAIKANPYGVVKYREFDTQPWSEGFLLNLKYRPESGSATFELLPKYE